MLACAMTAKNNPFAALDALRASLPQGSPPKEKPVKPPTLPARAVVRLEKKGRRGKDVTVIEKLGLKPAELETWCRDLKQAMGCGGTIEEEAIVLQGDLRSRLAEALTAKGVAKVTVSG
jgi:translation initiation factor 1